MNPSGLIAHKPTAKYATYLKDLFSGGTKLYFWLDYRSYDDGIS